MTFAPDRLALTAVVMLNLAMVASPSPAADAPRRAQGFNSAPVPASAPQPAPGSRTVALNAMIEAARRDAAKRSGQSDSAVQLVLAEAVDWPDGGLGCPRPGVRYTMALVPGYHIQLKAQDRLMNYHASQRGALWLCPGARASRPAPNSKI